jgi:DNA-binding LytR/AlgR family response regulator
MSVASSREDECQGDGRGVRIAIVWAVRFARESLAEILERDPLVSVVGQYSDFSEAVALGSVAQADVVLLDTRMPGAAADLRRFLEIAPPCASSPRPCARRKRRSLPGPKPG